LSVATTITRLDLVRVDQLLPGLVHRPLAAGDVGRRAVEDVLAVVE